MRQLAKAGARFVGSAFDLRGDGWSSVVTALNSQGRRGGSARRDGTLNTAILSLIGAWSLVCVALVTAVVVTFGPAPHSPATSGLINSPSAALIEPSDQIALVAWILLAALLGLVSLALMRRRRPQLSARVLAWRERITWTLGATAVACATASILWGSDPVGGWPGITIMQVITGIVAAAAILWMLVVTDARWRVGSLVIAGLVLALVIPAWLQVPGAVRDIAHFLYTADEIASVAAGHFPLSDYVPQYSVLLPFLAAPMLAAAPSHAAALVLLTMLALQLVTCAVAVALPVLVGGRRMAGPAMLVILAPTFALTSWSTSASTYFAAMPLRVVLPVVTILVAYLVLRNQPPVELRALWRWLGLGALAGATALNNPDFGLAAYLAVVVTVVVATSGLRGRLFSVPWVLAGGAAVFVGYGLLGAVLGRPVHWSWWLTFQRIFGAVGYMNVAMQPFGLHIAMVSLFVAASALGFVLVRISVRRAASGMMYRQGVLLCLTGGWSLLCLPYIAGRSLPTTYVGGLAFSTGLVVASMLPLFRMAARAIRTRTGAAQQVGVALSVIALAGTSTPITMLGSPSVHVDALNGAQNQWQLPVLIEQAAHLRKLQPVGAGPGLVPLIADGTVVQALPLSSMVALVDGIPSASVASSPEYTELSPFFAQAQCGKQWARDARYLLVRDLTAQALRAEPACADYVDWSAQVSYSAPVDAGGAAQTDPLGTWVLLPRGTEAP